MSESETPPPPPPPPEEDEAPPTAPSAPPVRPLLRRDHDKHLAGVAGGLADYFGVDATLMRVALVVLAFLGVGVPLYLVGWLAMPSPSMPRSYIERWFGRSPSPAAVVAVAAGLIVLIAASDGPDDGGGLGWGLALLFGGWLLFRADSRAIAGAGVPPPPPAAGAPAAETSTWRGPGGGMTAPFVWPPPAPKPRPRSVLGRLTIGIALASVGVAWLLGQAGYVELGPAQHVALGLTIIGAGLIVGAWVGRAYGLIAVGALLLPVMVALSVLPLPVPPGVGEFSYAPTSIESLQSSYGVGLGQMVLDLTQLDLSGQSATTTVTVGAGETRIVVPDDITVSADVEMRAGEINLFDRKYVGRPFGAAVTGVAEGTGSGRLDLIVEGGIGKVTVHTSPAVLDGEL